ncbi:MAG TPA: hypothetical protein P5089_00160 [Candidatus Portnoybacteria bacterium]|nr:hypothetical protein [Candidatus Portnoybacteria bacterium]
MSGQAALLEELKKETGFYSIVSLMTEVPAFKKVILQGERIIPAILHDLKENGPDRALFLALKQLSKKQPKLPIIPGDMEQTKNIWLEWGQKNGYLN